MGTRCSLEASGEDGSGGLCQRQSRASGRAVETEGWCLGAHRHPSTFQEKKMQVP